VRYRRVVGEPSPLPEEPRTRADPQSEQMDPGPSEDDPLRRPAATEPVEREVSYEDLARGYEVAPGQHVVMEPEELEALRPEPSRVIEIEHFVALAEIDPVHFEKSYQLSPADDIGEKPYGLLHEAMKRTGRVAVGRFVLRTREHLVVIRPTRGILGLETMYFADEVREPVGEGLRAAGRAVTEGEVDMARGLIEVLSADWDPDRYRDPYRERVLELIREREPTEVPPEGGRGGGGPPIADLMAALKASVEAAKEGSHASDRPAEG
jgi:DNA end-binding protein Ku